MVMVMLRVEYGCFIERKEGKKQKRKKSYYFGFINIRIKNNKKKKRITLL